MPAEPEGGTEHDPVAAVIRMLRETRGLRPVRRFRHGSGGARMVLVDDHVGVLKAWALDSPLAANLPSAHLHMRRVGQRGVAVPRTLDEGCIAGCRYVLYERLAGRWPARVSARVLDEMCAVVAAERGAAAGEGGDWPDAVRAMLADGYPLFDIATRPLHDHPVAAGMLAEARARLDACPESLLRRDDVVHGDFAPENVLVDGGRLCGVVDWEQSRAGDAGFDLVGMQFDMELGAKGAPTVAARLRGVLRDAMPPAVLALYTAVYAVRCAGWAIGTDMEPDVLHLGRLLLDETRSG